MKNDSGFTLIEMLVVLLIITVLLIIALPNITENNNTIRTKGCEAFTLTAEAQVEAYYMKNGTFPATLDILEEEGYLKQATCPNGDTPAYDSSTGAITADVTQP
ncbi:competence type IV pilus major pilin ComGC [Salimicrobium flavidum]|uniref:ComG operon protein 3 n=1 Tax=Salimicrobium flavidum TaxID=570947 RepID=A0A1N7IIU4_9BACI|nr:competence type IV pilus major pilin ComGC [Salimicrobium flavidum]SIS36916.1 competence protein ComGC [Salimicrobium flavidum]